MTLIILLFDYQMHSQAEHKSSANNCAVNWHMSHLSAKNPRTRELKTFKVTRLRTKPLRSFELQAVNCQQIR